MRLKAVQPYLRGEEMFLANYSAGVSDLPLPAMVYFMEAARGGGLFRRRRALRHYHLAASRTTAG